MLVAHDSTANVCGLQQCKQLERDIVLYISRMQWYMSATVSSLKSYEIAHSVYSLGSKDLFIV